ncbi:helix-turn-helix transcriptional regulator [Actinoplanes bogorensis]|uniref:Helix-turn-helix transcriptional regulator n=1 Tax=Paractinoplanes bogorensis TaxID=1610840 RepID=A0ABS5YQ89_9ACTN|nr:helix-turn-helix transcriptional regulator [Actinoplanes bogorensis]MBU2664894.1 helix-turn-helix transcriptional regulator [Actinoplanes bogorensis]
MSVQRFERSATDADIAMDILNDVFIPEKPFQLQSTGQPVRLSLRGVQSGDLHATRFSWGDLACHGVAAPFGDFTTVTLLSGGINWSAGHERLALRGGDVFRVSTTAANDAMYVTYDIITISVPTAVIERVAEAHLGAVGPSLRFDGMAPVSAAAGRQWLTLAGYVRQMFTTPGPGLDSPLILERLIDMIAAAALTIFPNTTMTGVYQAGPGRVAPAALRRAVAYIDANAHRPISLTDIADAAGITGRAVQAAFRRHYELTPMAYLRRARLNGAHRELQVADPATGATVAAVAARWGFGPASGFATFYREQFGVSPSHTLRT